MTNKSTSFAVACSLLLLAASVRAQTQPPATNPAAHSALPPVPAPMNLPHPGPQTDQPYAPQPIMQGGVVMTLYPPGSKLLNMNRITEPEQYNVSRDVPGRINSIVNIHNPSIEVHT